MNQLKKEYLNLLVESGVHTFQSDSTNNYYDFPKKKELNKKVKLQNDLKNITSINQLTKVMKTIDKKEIPKFNQMAERLYINWLQTSAHA